MTAQPGRDEQSAEQYLDALPDYGECDMDATPGFRAFVLYAMETICGRPSGGELCSMHMAYQAGLAHASAGVWHDERPTDGEWFVAIEPSKRRHQNVIPVRIAKSGFMMMGFFGQGGKAHITSGLFHGAKWKRRETPADPFLLEVTDGK